MKKIYSILLAAVALLSIAPFAKAQVAKAQDTPVKSDNGRPYILVEEGDAKGLAYSKKIAPPSNGQYIITLESFVTGQLSVVDQSVPADIVLILDKSGSMDEDFDNNYILTYANTNYSVGYRYNTFDYTSTNNHRWYSYNKKYYRVYRGNDGSDYYLYFDANGTRYYLNGTEITTGLPRGKSASDNIWNGPLYAYNSEPSKMDALKSAVYGFIEEIDRNDRIDPKTKLPRSERLGNRISIISFSSSTATKKDAALTKLGNNKSINDYTGKYSLLGIVRQLNTGGGTYVENGTELAKNEIATSSSEAKTVVLFTDGIPGNGYWSGYRYNGSSVTSANDAIDDANVMKADDVTVWTIGVFQGLSGDDKTKTYRYMSRVSSDWGSNAPHMDDTSGQTDPKKYFQDVTTGDLTEVFKTIAGESGGSSIELDGETTSTVDIVSKSFTLPEGGKVEDIKIYTYDCTGIATVEYEEDGVTKTGEFLQFGNKQSSSLEPTLGKTDPTSEKYDSISVKGFNYSNNWCGYNQKTGEYQGQKLSIEIPVMMADDAVGGADIQTNAPGSGIYIAGQDTPFVEFVSPVVSLPINIHIRKEGLNEGESSKFTIQRKLKSENDDAWKDVTSVFVTRHSDQEEDGENAPITKVVGLPSVTKVSGVTAEYVYRIIEDDWCWSYTLDEIYGYNVVYDNDGNESLERVDMTNTGALSTSINKNPFIFKNSKSVIEPKVRHAESKVTNTFKPKTSDSTEGDIKYDDSKKNTGTGRE